MFKSSIAALELTFDDSLLVENYGLHWLDMGIGPGDIRPEWRAEAHRFLKEARDRCELAAFIAEVDGNQAGTRAAKSCPPTFPAYRSAVTSDL